MPILTREIDLYPEDLLGRDEVGTESDACWWALYTRSRREKDVMRRLLALQVPFYGPCVEQSRRTPQGRVRTSYLPLFSNYVFLYGDGADRYSALTTNCISQIIRVPDGRQLTEDLRRIHQLIQTDVSVTLESRLVPGTLVRIRSGPFRGQEGVIVKRRGKTRLLVTVNFLQQGASVELNDFEVERL